MSYISVPIVGYSIELEMREIVGSLQLVLVDQMIFSD